MDFAIDLGAYKPLSLDPQAGLSAAQQKQLSDNVELCRDAIIFLTGVAEAKGLGGHTGGPYDIVPEVLIADGFMRGPADVVPIYFDEAGHRVAIQYLMSALNGHMPAERLLHYREADSKLPGHPERHFTPGVEFSSGRLGHMWPYANGVALANPGRTVVVFGSDGSQQEGNNAEAARLAVARNIPIKLFIDDNDVTIAGHPSEYMPGFDVARTLTGHGLSVSTVDDAEDYAAVHAGMCTAMQTDGPYALVLKRPMAPGLEGIEGTPKGHDVVKASAAIEHLGARGQAAAVDYLKSVVKPKRPGGFKGSSENMGKNRDEFGKCVCAALEAMPEADRVARVRVFDNDLEGSCGLTHIRKAYPEVYISAGIMERGNYSAAAGFGMEKGKQGIFGTFSAFMEMCISEITMARLNESNVLAHFSHAGVDDMADNTCHFGLNNFFADGGLEEGDETRLYFPSDVHQMRALVARIFDDPGLRFVFSTRSGTPEILTADGAPMYAGDYAFSPGRDEVIREGSAGTIVSYGEMLYRSLDAVERLRAEGIDVGLIAKPTLNVIDEQAMATVGESPFVLVVESQNRSTGLGMRYGSWLLERGHSPRYAHMGSTRAGNGGLWEHMTHQGIDPDSIVAKVRELLG